MEGLKPWAEYLTEKGAKALADKIRAYWRSKGKEPRVWVEQTQIKSASSVYVVRSDMVGGMPS